MPEYQARRRGGAAAYHVLVGSTDIGRYNLEYCPMPPLAARRIFQLGKGDRLNFNLPGPQVHDTTIMRHDGNTPFCSPSDAAVRVFPELFADRPFQHLARNTAWQSGPEFDVLGRFDASQTYLGKLDQISFAD